jgi:nucleoside-diphosphate-sugar epimerase
VDSVFVSGAGGFLGSRLAAALVRSGRSVTGLDRSPGPAVEGLTHIQADLHDGESYAPALPRGGTVLHLAAATGKATREEHFRANLEGTRGLLARCREAGVRRFVFVSSIAARFEDQRRYWYAQSKLQAEAAVRESGIQHLIVRPTILVGPGAGALEGLIRLAGLPTIVLFGSGRTPVQPIWGDDLVDFMLAIVDDEPFDGRTLELGGPTVLSIEQLLREVRRVRTGKTGPLVRIPLGLVRPPLALAETLGLSLPVTVGQLASFRCGGAIEPNSLHRSRIDRLMDVPTMLERSLA